MNLFNKLIALTLPFVPKPIVGFFSRHYIAGDHLEDAVKLIRELNSQGMMATLDVLGEEVKEKEQSLKAVDLYKSTLQAIHREKLDANISVKPTHMGLTIDKEFCYENIKGLVSEAAKLNNFVRIDMEDASTTDDTIDIYLRLKKDFDNVGTVLQSYLRRTIADINQLIPHKANLRYCKGIYNEKREIAYKDKTLINENFNYGLEKLLNQGCYVGIATHDEKLVWYALKLIDQMNLKPDKYEFQMLLGVDHELRRVIVNSGHRLRVYVPFGAEWFGYSTRRLKENPAIAGHIIRGLLNRIFGLKQ
ncbi:MAG: proline dehydrogenase family protein [Calditrichia bacterium]|nr:proline dehydrogenase family protein [Calditrichia bacterium]